MLRQSSEIQKKRLRYIFIGVAIVLGLLGVIWAYLFFSAPSMVRLPKMEHAHFRMQVIVDGKKENFADIKYQQTYKKDLCSAELSKEPIHFHDSKDQIVHLHWKGATGGNVLKYYGWNLSGGADKVLGYRFDTSFIPEAIPIHGVDLPAIPSGAKLWIYTGNEDTYRQRDLAEFLNQDLETFFDRKSTVNVETAMNLQSIFAPTASAHDGPGDHNPKTHAQLEDINNLLGNIVLFAQPDEPAAKVVKERFDALEPLTDSTCGG